MVPLLISAGLWGCTTPPVFNGIGEVVIHTQGANGVKKDSLELDKLERASQCLYSTVEIDKSQAKKEVLQELLMVEVKDRLGDRMFEFYTDENFKGNRGKYYRNTCLYRIIKSP